MPKSRRNWISNPGKYLVLPYDRNGLDDYAAEGCNSKKGLKALLKAYREAFPGAEAVKI